MLDTIEISEGTFLVSDYKGFTEEYIVLEDSPFSEDMIYVGNRYGNDFEISKASVLCIKEK